MAGGRVRVLVCGATLLGWLACVEKPKTAPEPGEEITGPGGEDGGDGGGGDGDGGSGGGAAGGGVAGTPNASNCTYGEGTKPGPCVTDMDTDLAMSGIEKRVKYTYDGSTRVREDWDDGADGRVDGSLVFGFGPDGQMQDETELDAAGNPVERTTYLRDEMGREAGTETVALPAGNVIARSTYTRDAAGRVTLIVHDTDANPATPPQQTRYVYDAGGTQIATERDRDADGVFEIRITYQHDGAGNLIERRVDRGPDGLVDAYTRYEYDASCNLMAELVYEGGTLVEQYTNSYACFP